MREIRKSRMNFVTSAVLNALRSEELLFDNLYA